MPGERVPRGNMTPLYDDGEHIVANGPLDPLAPPIAAVVNFLTGLFELGLGVVVSMFDFHRNDRGSNPGRGGEFS